MGKEMLLRLYILQFHSRNFNYHYLIDCSRLMVGLIREKQ